MTRRLTQARFDLFAIGTRLSPSRLISEELSYWSDLDENVIGVVFRDTADDDFGWALLVRDRIGRFRGVRLDVSIPSQRRAEAGLRLAIAEASRNDDLAALGIQGDETNAAIDLLTVLPGTDPGQLHPYFLEVLNRPGRAPARAVLKEIGPWLTAVDPHFVREFQRHQFDQRLWELYLWAALREGGYDVAHLGAPDFHCSAPGIAFTVEATTVAPSTSGVMADRIEPTSPKEVAEFLATYMPIKYGSSLTGKLNRRSAQGKAYWEEPGAEGKPFVIAIADFHKPADEDGLGAMTYTQSAIWPYLYGRIVEWRHVDGKLEVTTRTIDEFRYQGKAIEAGFFDLPGAENVSAVLFSNAGTIAKFDRIGVLAGYAAPDHRYLRAGFRYNPDPDAVVPTRFSHEVAEGELHEGWADELQVFHNPRALRPIPPEFFAGLTQHFLEGEQLRTTYSGEAILSSFSIVLQGVSEMPGDEAGKGADG